MQLGEFCAELLPVSPHMNFKQSSSEKFQSHQPDSLPTEVKFIGFREFEQFTGSFRACS